MSKVMIYAVYDSKVKYFHKPMFMRNKGEALRSWTEVANEKDHAISRHPEDFVLFELGDYDDQTATITMHTAPEPLGSAVQFKQTLTQPTLFNQNAN